MCPKKTLKLAIGLLPVSIALMALGVWVGFIDHDAWGLQSQIAAHVGLMLAAGALKLGYVMYLNTCRHLGINEFAALGTKAHRDELPACCRE